MNFSLRLTAMGLAVFSIGWQDAGTQAPTPAERAKPAAEAPAPPHPLSKPKQETKP
jgi:hypothetical protein